MFLSEWREFLSAPCLARKKTWYFASRCCRNSARPWHTSEHVSFLGGLRTYQHLGSGFLYYQIDIFIFKKKSEVPHNRWRRNILISAALSLRALNPAREFSYSDSDLAAFCSLQRICQDSTFAEKCPSFSSGRPQIQKLMRMWTTRIFGRVRKAVRSDY